MPDIVGLTLHRHSLRGVEVRLRRGRAQVLRTGLLECDDRRFIDGQTIDVDLLAASLPELWASAGFRSKRVRVVIDGRLAVVRRTELPSLPEAEQREAAAIDIGDLLNFSIDDALFDVDEIEQFDRNETRWAKALVVAVPESSLIGISDAVRHAGLRFAGSDLAAEALIRSLTLSPEGVASGDDAPVALVNFGHFTTTIVIRDSSGLLFARTLSVGLGETEISVAEELESALAQLSGASGNEGGTGDAAPGVSAVVEGLRRTLSYYRSELDARPIRMLAVAGVRSQTPGLMAAITDTLGLDVEEARSTLEWESSLRPNGFELGAGGALGAAPSDLRHLVLTSDRERRALQRRRNRAAMAASAIPALIVAGLGVSSVWGEVEAAREDVERQTATGDALALRADDLAPTDDVITRWEQSSAAVQSIEGQRVDPIVVTRELASVMPEGTRLVRLSIDRTARDRLPPGYDGPQPIARVELSGVADDLAAVGRWLAATEDTQTLAGVWLTQTTESPNSVDGRAQVLFTAEGMVTSAALRPDSLIAVDVDELEGGR